MREEISPDQLERLKKIKAAAFARLRASEKKSELTVQTSESKRFAPTIRKHESNGLGNTILSNQLGIDTTRNRRQNLERIHAKAIRIDMEIKNMDDFLEYLQTREPRRQKRQRYQQSIKDISGLQTVADQRSTFISKESYPVDAEHVELYINGKPSSDFAIKTRKYQNSIELYLDYTKKKKYVPEKHLVRDESRRPVVKQVSKPVEETVSPQQGKRHIFGTMVNLDGFYQWLRNGRKFPESKENTKEAVKYLNKSDKTRRNVFERYSTVEETQDTVHIHVAIPNIEEMENQKLLDAHNILQDILTIIHDELYIGLFSEDNIVVQELHHLCKDLSQMKALQRFLKLEEEASPTDTIIVDGVPVSFYLKYPIEELSQCGNGQQQDCRFKPMPAEILISEDQKKVMVKSTLSKSIMVFTTSDENWFLVAYFLHRFLSSKCRYKRSLPPLHILHSLGVTGLYKLYSNGFKNQYYPFNWIYIRNTKDERQNYFVKTLEQIFPSKDNANGRNVFTDN